MHTILAANSAMMERETTQIALADLWNSLWDVEQVRSTVWARKILPNGVSLERHEGPDDRVPTFKLIAQPSGSIS